ncbi:MAG: hypothetical protein ACRDNZ_03660 [Streptosporangiaceae bacterium]
MSRGPYWTGAGASAALEQFCEEGRQVDGHARLPGRVAVGVAEESRRRAVRLRGEHGGSGQYVFLGPDGGHYRRSNYARRVLRPACDGLYLPTNGGPRRVVITDVAVWPGVPIASWPPASPDTAWRPPGGRRIQAIPPGAPLSCWLPVKPGLTLHGLRHGHKTWMAEDGIPEILAEQRLGHDVPGMRGLYAHASERMRAQLAAALQARWDESLSARAAIASRSPVPLLDALLAPSRDEANHARNDHHPDQPAPNATVHLIPAPGGREKMTSQIPPKYGTGPIRDVG